MILMSGLLRAQTVQVMDNVIFKSNDPSDGVQTLAFGFGTEYTDSTDFDKGEQIIPPFFPPDGFYVFFAIKDRFGSEDFAVRDIRGVPDSVKSGVAKMFSKTHLLRIQRFRGQNVSINFDFPFLRGMDSVVFESTQAGANFAHTFTGRESVVIPSEFIRTLRMTAYYNFERAADVVTYSAAARRFNVSPNPARSGGSVTLRGTINAGSRVLVCDMRGALVQKVNIDETVEELQIDTHGLPAGTYLMRVVEAGRTETFGRFVLVD